MVYGVLSVIFLLCADDVIREWLGQGYTLGEPVAIWVALNFYVYGIMSPLFAFRGATGLFREARYALLAAALVNIVLSVLFGHIWGVAGVIAATVVARLSTSFWFEHRLLFARHIGGSFGHSWLGTVGRWPSWPRASLPHTQPRR